MMKTIYSIGTMCLLLVLLMSCTNTQFPTSPTPEATGTTTAKSSTPVPSPVTSQPALTATPTAENTSEPQILTPCVNAGNPSNLSASPTLPGTLIFKVGEKIVAVNGASLAEQEILNLASIDEDWFIAGLSPDGKWFGYFTQSPMPLKVTTAHLISSAGETVSVTVPILPGLPESSIGYDWFPVNWINNESILVDGGLALGGQLNIALFNPFTGLWHQSPISSLPNRNVGNGVALSPDLTRALYFTEHLERLILWDIELQQELWREDLGTFFSGVPGLTLTAWSVDSSIIAFPLLLPGEQTAKSYIIDRDGNNAWLIRPEAPANGAYGLSWSPDGSYLAFVSSLASAPEHGGIIIYDRERNIAIDMCSLGEGENPIDELEPTGRLIWSPDGRYLVYGIGQETPDEYNRIVMLDVYTGVITVLKEGLRITLVGWSGIDSWIEP